jgi:predicted adenine nucleotide alpha hydrolase (AANH) superfamily ATPase
MNNHKYEIIKNESVSTLTNAELEDIIKIIEKTEKFENRDTSTYFVNGNLIKRTPIEQQIETTKRKDPPKIIVTKHDEDLKPSFTVSENLYKMYLNKKGEKQNFNTISKAAGLNEKKDEARIKNYGQDFRNTVNVQALKDNFKNFKSSKEFGLNTKL